jgi:hypothetical protein
MLTDRFRLTVLIMRIVIMHSTPLVIIKETRGTQDRNIDA